MFVRLMAALFAFPAIASAAAHSLPFSHQNFVSTNRPSSGTSPRMPDLVYSIEEGEACIRNLGAQVCVRVQEAGRSSLGIRGSFGRRSLENATVTCGRTVEPLRRLQDLIGCDVTHYVDIDTETWFGPLSVSGIRKLSFTDAGVVDRIEGFFMFGGPPWFAFDPAHVFNQGIEALEYVYSWPNSQP